MLPDDLISLATTTAALPFVVMASHFLLLYVLGSKGISSIDGHVPARRIASDVPYFESFTLSAATALIALWLMTFLAWVI